MKITLNIEKRYVYVIIGVLVLTLGFLVVYAYNSGGPASFVGHTWDEIVCDNNMCVDTNTGNVGIGTTGPQGAEGLIGTLKVNHRFSADKLIDINKGDWQDNDDIQIHLGDLILNSRKNGSDNVEADNLRGSNGNLGFGAKNKIFFYTQDTASESTIKMTLLNNGNLGIGTETPTQKLDVNGNIHATGDICTDQGGGKCLSSTGGGGSGSTSYSCGNTCSLWYTTYHFSHVHFACFKIDSTHCVTYGYNGVTGVLSSFTHTISGYASCGQIRIIGYQDPVMGDDYTDHFICTQLGWVRIG